MIPIKSNYIGKYLVSNNFHNHFAEKISRTARPPVLLETEGLKCTWKFTLHLCYKTQIYMSPKYRNFQPLRPARTARSMSSTVVRSFHPPASGSLFTIVPSTNLTTGITPRAAFNTALRLYPYTDISQLYNCPLSA
ncbi:30S ribosomal protein S2 [Striga asiatica]|uniref:30S ribosomal protein S2 n=1 Tax=Striga asiatica TaxID=4170 RepID=A0A5A7Q3U6_STRAF|nr:30S ribosomal protein S2 [Striga asiatica]